MALVVEDRVRETSTTAGTGTFTLAGAVTGYQSFSAVGNGNTTYYTIYLQGGNEWEVGIGTYTSSGTTLSRDTVLASSSGGAKINFSAGVKDVFVTYPADWSVSQYDVGTGANQLPLNQYLGNLAYQDAGSIAGQVGLSAGTAALPSLVSATDTDTGMWFPAANTLAWSTGGVRAITVTSSQNVGIGTDSPGGGSRLHVDASGGGIVRVTRLASSATAYGQLENDGTNSTLTSSAALIFNAGGSSERARFTSTGGFETKPAATGHAVFNEDGVDADFRVESDNQTHMLFVDAGNDVVAIGTSDIQNWYQRAIQGASWAITELLGVDQTGWSTGCYQDAYGYITDWKFKGSYAASLYTQTADHTFFVTTSTRAAGNAITWRNVLALSDSAAVFNEDSNDIDFRVESDTQTHMLFVDAGDNSVNINTNTPLGGKLNVNGAIYGNENHKVHYPLPIFNFGAGGISDEYWVLARRYVGSSILASGLMGRIVGTRGSTTSGNTITYQNVIVQSAYLSNDVVGIDSQGSTPSFEAIDIISISGVEYYAARGRASGGPCDNGLWFEGMMVNNTGDTNVFSYTRASTPGVSVITTNVATVNSWVFRDTYLQAQRAGYDRQTINGTETNFNDAGLDYDFRVESDTDTHCLFVDASANNVGIGTNAPGARLDVAGSAGLAVRALASVGYNASSDVRIDIGASNSDCVNNSATYAWKTETSGDANGQALTFSSYRRADTTLERARITSGGNLLVGTITQPVSGVTARLAVSQSLADYSSVFVNSQTTAANCYGTRIQYTGAAPNGTGNPFLVMVDTGGDRAVFRSNGGLANYQSNNVDLSDIRTKTDINPLASYWNKIAALEIVTYKYKDQTHDDLNIGVIAQQVEQVAPEFVDADGFGETPEDGVPLKTIYNKDLTFAAIKALQEAMARIEKLEAEVAALKGA